jgi:hypothetical protein
VPCTRTGSPLPTNTKLKFWANGGYVRTNGDGAPAVVGSGDGSTAAEQFYAYQPQDLSSAEPVQPGSTALLRSVATGLFCRLAALPSDSSQQGMLCDQATAAAATIFTYTGSGLSFNGEDLASAAPGQPLVLWTAGSSSAPAGATSELGFSLAGLARAASGWQCWLLDNTAAGMRAAGQLIRARRAASSHLSVCLLHPSRGSTLLSTSLSAEEP